MEIVGYWHETIKNYRYDGDVSVAARGNSANSLPEVWTIRCALRMRYARLLSGLSVQREALLCLTLPLTSGLSMGFLIVSTVFIMV